MQIHLIKNHKELALLIIDNKKLKLRSISHITSIKTTLDKENPNKAR